MTTPTSSSGEPLAAVPGPGDAPPSASPAPSQPTSPYDIDEDEFLDSSQPAPVLEPTPAPVDSLPARNPDGTFKPKSEHPRYLSRQARDLGFTDTDLAELTTDELGAAVYAASRQVQLNSQVRDHTPRQAEVREPETEEPFRLDADVEEAIEPRFVAPIKAAFAKMQKEIKELKEQLTGVSQREQQREARTGVERLDACFQSQSELFGTGTGQKLQKTNPALFQKRLAVIAVMKSLEGGSVEERYQEAVEIIYGQQSTPVQPPKAQEPSATQKLWSQAALARPTHRNGAAEPKGAKKATQAVAALQREMNGATEGEDVSVDDFPE